jgi:zona occludens toxin (predicted ATPase)
VRYIISMPAARPPAVGPVRNRPPLERLMSLPIITTTWNTAPAPMARNTMDATGDATKPPIQVPAIAGAPAMIPSATRYAILAFLL